MIKKLTSSYNKLSLPLKAAFWYTFCNFLNKGISLLTTPIFTRILTEKQYGIYSVYQSWINIIIIFTSLNIFMSSYTKGLLKYKDNKEDFTTSQLGLMLTITSVLGIFALLNIEMISKLLGMPQIIIIGMIIELISMPIIELWLAKERFDYKYKSIIIITISVNVISLLISIIAIIFTKYKIEARVFSNAFVKFAFIIPLVYFILCKSKKLYNKDYWKYALLFNLPLIPHYLSNFILTQSDRIMISRLIGNVEAAFYSVAYTISTVVVLLITATNNALTPYIYKSIESNKIENIRKKMSPIIILMACLVILIIVFAPEIIAVFAGKQYLDAIYVIPPVAASVFFIYIYSLFSNVEYYYQKTTMIALATTICAIINIVLNYFLIPKFGYYVAGYTTLVCYLLLAMFHFLAYKIILKKKMPNVKNIYDLKVIWFCAIFVIISMVVMALTYKNILIRYSVLVVLILFLLFNKKNIIRMIKKEKE